MSFEQDRVERKGFRALQYDAGVDRRVQCGSVLFAAAEYVLAKGKVDISSALGGLQQYIREPYTVCSICFQAVKTLSIVCQLDSKILQAFIRFFLFGCYKLLFCHFRIVVYGAGQRSK